VEEMIFRCLSCDSTLTSNKWPTIPCDCGGYWLDKSEYQFVMEKRGNTPKKDLEDSEELSDLDKYIQEEVEKFKKTQEFLLLDKEFQVTTKYTIREHRRNYLEVDSWLVNDYILLFEIHPEDVENVDRLLSQEDIHYYIVNNSLVFFLDTLISTVDKIKFAKILKRNFDITLDEYQNDRIIPELYKSDKIEKDLLGLKTIQTNHLKVRLGDSRSYDIHKSKKRILLI